MAAIAAILFSMLIADDTGGPPVHTPRFVPPAGDAENGGGAGARAPGEKSLTLTEEQLAELLAEGLPEDFPVKEAAVELTESVIHLTGAGSKTALVGWAERQGISLPTSVTAALAFLPDLLEFDAELIVDGDPHNGLLRLSTGRFAVCGAELPEGALGETLPQAVADTINGALLESGRYFTSVRVEENRMELWTAPEK